jgi:hypothetical protein
LKNTRYFRSYEIHQTDQCLIRIPRRLVRNAG